MIRISTISGVALLSCLGFGLIDSNAVTMLTATIDTTFPKGAALADWLQSLQATATRGQVNLTATEHSVDAVFAPTQRWISTADGHTQYLTFNTPIEAPTSQPDHVGAGEGAGVHVLRPVVVRAARGCPADSADHPIGVLTARPGPASLGSPDAFARSRSARLRDNRRAPVLAI